MGYLPVSRELLNSSFWRSLADKEKVILIEMMAMAAYKPMTYNLYGKMIELSKYELCFSTKILADRWDISVHVLRNIIDKLNRNNIALKKRRQLGNTENNTDGYTKIAKNNNQFFLSLTFYGWVFDDNLDCQIHSREATPKTTPNLTAVPEHNKEILKKEVLKKETRRNSACAGPSFQGSQSVKHRKPWISMEQIAEMDLPHADEIMKEWTTFSGRSKKQVTEVLQKFTRRQRLFGLPEMTLDIFDKEFRKEMKQVFALKSKHKNEPVQQLHYFKKR